LYLVGFMWFERHLVRIVRDPQFRLIILRPRQMEAASPSSDLPLLLAVSVFIFLVSSIKHFYRDRCAQLDERAFGASRDAAVHDRGLSDLRYARVLVDMAAQDE
jgi:hypothetical protein